MTFKRALAWAVEIVGEDWVEWLSTLEPQLKLQVLETQIGFAIYCKRADLRDAFEAIRAYCIRENAQPRGTPEIGVFRNRYWGNSPK